MKQLFILLLLLFSFSTHADEIETIIQNDFKKETIGCNIILKTLAKYYEKPARLPMVASYENHGLFFKHDFNSYIEMWDQKDTKWSYLESYKYKRSADGNIIVTNIFDQNKIDAGLNLNSVVTKLNGLPVSEMSDQELDNLFIKKGLLEIEFLTKNSTKTISSKISPYDISIIDVELKEKIISEIDSKNSEHSANIDFQVRYTMTAKAFDAIEIVKKAIDKKLKDDPTLNISGFACLISPETFKKIGLFNPQIKIVNLIDAIAGMSRGESYLLSYDMWGQLSVVKRFSIINGKFKNNFKFQSFPFDAQRIGYEVMLVNNGWASERNTVLMPASHAYDFLFNIKNVDLNEWKHSGADYKNTLTADGGYDNNTVTYYHLIERNYSYYIFKIILPIVIILFISWSVLWIRPKEIEARLTVSIVCLLSLIAYTFIIDKDIPKLSYLTIMDYVVLVSYFFSVLPTIQTIFVHNHINKKTNTAGLEYAKRIDNIAIKVIPAAYFIILFIIFNGVIKDNLHTIKSFTL